MIINTGYDILSRGERDRELLRANGLVFARTSKRLHNEIDPRRFLRVENQKQMSSCVGHGVSTAAECVAGMQKEDFQGVPQLSRWFAYRMGQKCWGHEGRDVGCTIAAGVQALEQYGIPPETLCPYPAEFNSTPIPSEVIDAAGKFRIRSHATIETADDWFGFLDQGCGAIVFGVLMTRQMSNCEGILTLKEVTEDGSRGGHCMAGIGFTHDRLIIANSWDTTWGSGGYAMMTMEAAEYLLSRPYTAAVGISDLTGFDKVRVLRAFRGVG